MLAINSKQSAAILRTNVFLIHKLFLMLGGPTTTLGLHKIYKRSSIHKLFFNARRPYYNTGSS